MHCEDDALELVREVEESKPPSLEVPKPVVLHFYVVHLGVLRWFVRNSRNVLNSSSGAK